MIDLFWFAELGKYLAIGGLAVVVGLPLCIILDAAIDLWEQWSD